MSHLEQFTNAVFALNGGGQASLPAMQYVENLKQNRETWKLCVLALRESKASEVKLFGLSLLIQTLQVHYEHPQFPDEDRNQIRAAVMLYIRDVCSTQQQLPFLKNKLATVLVEIVKHDYPGRWPTLFTDFISFLNSKGPEVLDVFLRFILALNQEIARYDAGRTEAENQHNALVKDTMRTHVVPNLVKLLCTVTKNCANTRVDLSNKALNCISVLIEWIDVQLIVNDEVLTMLYAALNNPQLQTEAAQCLRELVYKGMPSANKLQLLDRLKLFEVLGGINQSGLSKPFATKIAILVNTVGEQITSIQKALGTKLGEGKITQEENKVRVLTFPKLDQALTLGLQILKTPDYRISGQVTMMFQKHLTQVKRARKRDKTTQNYTAQQERQQEAKHATEIFQTVLKVMVYPQWYRHDDKDNDEKQEFEGYRDDLVKLFKALLEIFPEEVLVLMKGRVQELLANLNTAYWGDIEAALYLIYAVGPLFSGHIKKSISTEPFRSIIGSVFSSQISKYPHPMVLMTYYSVCTRYAVFVELFPEMLPNLLFTFLDERGIGNPSAVVRSRACYYLWKLVDGFSPQVQRGLFKYASQILGTFQKMVEPVLLQGIASSQTASYQGPLLTFTDCEFLCEVAGILCSSTTSGDQCFALTSSFVGFLKVGLDRALENSNQWIQQNPAVAGKLYSQFITYIGCVSKALTKDAQRVAQVFGGCFTSVLKAFSILPNHPDVRKKLTFFIHRMVHCLHDTILPHLPNVIRALLDQVSSEDVVEFLQLVSDIMQKYKERSFEMMNGLLYPIHVKMSACLVQFSQINFSAVSHLDGKHHSHSSSGHEAKQGVAAFSHESRAAIGIVRIYYGYLRNVAENVPGVFLSEHNAANSETLLTGVMGGCTSPPHPGVHKLAFVVLKTLMLKWHTQSNGQIPENLKKFMFQGITVNLFQCLVTPDFNMKDAAYDAVLWEIVKTQLLLVKLFGDQYGQFLQQFLVQSGFPQNVCQQYIQSIGAQLAQPNSFAFNKFFKEFGIAFRQQRLGNNSN